METALFFVFPFVHSPEAADTLQRQIDVGELSLSPFINGQVVTLANPCRFHEGDNQ